MNETSMQNLQPKPRILTLHRILTYTWFLLLLIILIILLDPVGRASTRLVLILVVPTFYLLGLILLYRHRKMFLTALLPGILFILLLLLPGWEPDRNRLQAAYVKSLESYENTPYIWGGESHRGIDCSGLVRQGLIDAHLRLAGRTLNPRLLRTALALWWYDCTARSLSEGYRGWTTRLFTADTIDAIPGHRLHPGNIAVTADGSHVLAYLGRHTWIEADPAIQKVIKVTTTPPTPNPWFHHRVHLLAWTQLLSSSLAAP